MRRARACADETLNIMSDGRSPVKSTDVKVFPLTERTPGNECTR